MKLLDRFFGARDSAPSQKPEGSPRKIITFEDVQGPDGKPYEIDPHKLFLHVQRSDKIPHFIGILFAELLATEDPQEREAEFLDILQRQYCYLQDDGLFGPLMTTLFTRRNITDVADYPLTAGISRRERKVA